MLEKILQTQKWLTKNEGKNTYRVCVGFDGFVDTIVRPVLGYTSDGQYKFFSTITEFGEYLQGKAQKGCAIELKKELEKSGGNAFIFANALARLGVYTDCLGAFGYPEVHKVFENVNKNLKLISIAQNGFCSALEFWDGKIMLADNSGLDEMDFQLLKERIGEKRLGEFVEQAHVLSFMNWSELKRSNDIWRGFLTEIFPKVKERKQMFLDISDCSGRDRQDILEMLMIIRQFSQYFDVTLSLNANEFQVVGDLLTETAGTKKQSETVETQQEKARLLFEYCGLSSLFLHLRDCAYGLCKNQEYCIKTRLIEKPRFSTGGGDNFNAGLLYGIMHQLDVETCMILGNAASGYYITRGESATERQLLLYLEEWEKELKNNIVF